MVSQLGESRWRLLSFEPLPGVRMHKGRVMSRTSENYLANFTLVFVALYAPLETWFSWSYGLTSPFYMVDVIGMALLFWGAMHSRRARPRSAAGLLAAAWAWSGANFWRALFGRVQELRAGGQLDYGSAELCVVACSTAIALACLAWAAYLTARANSAS